MRTTASAHAVGGAARQASRTRPSHVRSRVALFDKNATRHAARRRVGAHTGDRFLDKTDTTSNSGLGCVVFTWAMVDVRHAEVPRAAVEHLGMVAAMH